MVNIMSKSELCSCFRVNMNPSTREQLLTVDNNRGICVSLRWAACHMTFVESSVCFAQSGDGENTVEQHVGSAP